jgi:hypothetical protein
VDGWNDVRRRGNQTCIQCRGIKGTLQSIIWKLVSINSISFINLDAMRWWDVKPQRFVWRPRRQLGDRFAGIGVGKRPFSLDA